MTDPLFHSRAAEVAALLVRHQKVTEKELVSAVVYATTAVVNMANILDRDKSAPGEVAELHRCDESDRAIVLRELRGLLELANV